jgi:poly-beta-1,6-N-acetyl-D-glucosamine synthase
MELNFNESITADAAQVSQVNPLRYVLITPARNEAKFIAETIRSVIRQTVLPVKWVIVSDGSTDGTDDIVKEYANKYNWIEFVRAPERAERDFAGKVHAFNVGLTRVKDLTYCVVGSLDGDISFEEDYMSFLLTKFATTPKLGVAGTPFMESGASYDFRFSATEHVSGACQLFRRECYEGIGGYVPVKGGGIDVIAVLTARMLGWQTRTFTEKHTIHHRPEGTATGNVVKARFRDGQKDHALGAHPLWEIFRAVYQMSRKPVFVGGFAILCGYLWNRVRNVDKSVSNELMRFRRRDQMRRLRRFLAKLFPGGASNDRQGGGCS